jgi:organic radical activating enzyme
MGEDGSLGGTYSAERLAETVLSLWPGNETPFVVFTGGEPMLQVDSQLITVLRPKGCVVAIETNGTIPVIPGIDWITVSPKARAALRQTFGNELKLVYPQTGLDSSQYEGLAFEHFFLQPVASSKCPNAVMEAVEYCLSHARWRLSLQTHKLAGIK